MADHDIGTVGLLTITGPPLATRVYNNLMFTSYFRGVVRVNSSYRSERQEILGYVLMYYRLYYVYIWRITYMGEMISLI